MSSTTSTYRAVKDGAKRHRVEEKAERKTGVTDLSSALQGYLLTFLSGTTLCSLRAASKAGKALVDSRCPWFDASQADWTDMRARWMEQFQWMTERQPA